MPELQAFRQSFVDQLSCALPSNLRRYSEGESWAKDFARGAQESIGTSLMRGSLDLLPPSDGDLKDLENSIRLYKALPPLTPLQARDPRLWSRLTHVELWPYMRRRWPVEKHGDPGKSERYVLAHYFVPQNQSRALFRNGAARLWWYSRLTHDPERSNPYELTGVLLATLDVTQTVLERSLGRAPHVLAGFLEFLLDRRSDLLAPGNENREKVRRLAKALNLHGGVRLLDSMSKAEIVSFLGKILSRL